MPDEPGIPTEFGFYTVEQQVADAIAHLSPEDEERFRTEQSRITDVRDNGDGTTTWTLVSASGITIEFLVEKPKRPRWRRWFSTSPGQG
jgi:hypothetical protein